jgi:hypothetical protein
LKSIKILTIFAFETQIDLPHDLISVCIKYLVMYSMVWKIILIYHVRGEIILVTFKFVERSVDFQIFLRCFPQIFWYRVWTAILCVWMGSRGFKCQFSNPSITTPLFISSNTKLVILKKKYSNFIVLQIFYSKPIFTLNFSSSEFTTSENFTFCLSFSCVFWVLVFHVHCIFFLKIFAWSTWVYAWKRLGCVTLFISLMFLRMFCIICIILCLSLFIMYITCFDKMLQWKVSHFSFITLHQLHSFVWSHTFGFV